MHFLSVILGFFAVSDKIVADNLCQNFINEVTSLEAQFFYGFQLMMENVHSETYSLLIEFTLKTTISNLFCLMQSRKCQW
jgi:ribonucleoside-diphosphate reductase beta chain